MEADRSRGTIPLQIGGRVKQPGLVEIPFGATLRDVLDRFGGGMAPGSRLKAVQVGGPLGSPSGPLAKALELARLGEDE